MKESIKEAIDFLKTKKIFLVYCPNEILKTKGPFFQIDTLDQIEEIIELEDLQEKLSSKVETMVSVGDDNE